MGYACSVLLVEMGGGEELSVTFKWATLVLGIYPKRKLSKIINQKEYYSSNIIARKLEGTD